MCPPSDSITPLKLAQRQFQDTLHILAWRELFPENSAEARAAMEILSLIEDARYYIQLFEDDLYLEILKDMKEERPPHPW